MRSSGEPASCCTVVVMVGGELLKAQIATKKHCINWIEQRDYDVFLCSSLAAIEECGRRLSRRNVVVAMHNTI
jgi:hypothetical protein